MSSGLSVDVRAPHDHLVHFYDDDDEVDDAVAAHLGEGLRQDAVAVVIAGPRRRDAIEALLFDSGVRVDEARRAGRYIALDAAKALAGFMDEGAPDGRRFDQAIGRVIADAARTGRPIRAFGEMVALLWAKGNVAAAIELEALWNDLASRHQFSLYCAYPMASVAARDDLHAARRVCALHSDLVAPCTPPGPDRSTNRARRRSAIFIPTPGSVGAARQFVADALEGWGCQALVDDAVLVTSELATNAVRHADSPFRLALARSRSGVRIAIEDTSPTAPLPRAAASPAIDGRGMALIAHLSARWGSDITADGKTVWSELDA